MELSTIILLCLIAFLAGYVDAVVGGGGLIQVPAGLILMPTQAVSTIIGTLKVPSFIGTCFATYQYLQRVKIPLLRILLFTSIAFIAAFSGSLLLTRMSNQFMKPVIFFVLLVMAIYTFTKKDLGQSLQKEDIKYATIKGILICLIIGFYDGFIGPGGGSLFVLAFISILGYDFLNASAHEVHLNIVSKNLQARSRDFHFHLFIAPTKQNERIEWMLEKAIETGLDSITFIQTEHSEKNRVNMGRLEKICISAMKQSGEFYKPLINDLMNFKDVLNSNKVAVQLLAHCNSQFEKQSLQDYSVAIKNANINIFIGPEGDFSETEIKQAYEMGFKGLSLGSTRLRTETAGLYATMALSAVLGK